MLLSGVVVLLATAATLAAVVLATASAGRLLPESQFDWAIDRVALVLVAIAAFCISARSRLFGVDTAAYTVVFESYCSGQSAEQLGFSFFLSAAALNGLMLGACDVRLLPVSWILFIILGVMLARGSFGDKLRYLALLLVSLVGLELTTNALRQGLSAAVLLAAVSWFRQRVVLGAVLAAVAVALHSSAALVLVAVGLTMLSWRVFVVAMVGAVLVVAIALGTVTALGGPVGAFLYEIQKYLAHEPDEIWIRVLSFTSLLIIVAVPRLCAASGDIQEVRLGEGSYARAAKLAATSVPFIFLPYFGYRYIYGILPLVLWMALESLGKSRRLAGRTFGLLLFANLGLLAIWSYGSGYMRTVPFFE